jgi:hypothetical protein
MTIFVAFEISRWSPFSKWLPLFPKISVGGCVYIENGLNRHQMFDQSEQGIEFDLFKSM